MQSLLKHPSLIIPILAMLAALVGIPSTTIGVATMLLFYTFLISQRIRRDTRPDVTPGLYQLIGVLISLIVVVLPFTIPKAMIFAGAEGPGMELVFATGYAFLLFIFLGFLEVMLEKEQKKRSRLRSSESSE